MLENQNLAIASIVNSEIVLQHFGYWPDFHDAEVDKVIFETHPTGRYSVTFFIAASEMLSEVDEKGYYKQTKHCIVALQFIGIKEVEFNYFSHQNALFDLKFEASGNDIECTFESSVGLDAFIVAEEAFVMSLTPTKR
ncbi:Imm50 family immunity protein [Hymenobacter algoricola]|uniref:Immunity protein 50 n=1 Tax=Hymenobacter algoricola TaxID=486267 RepID=A0ABP7NGT9_9BACT